MATIVDLKERQVTETPLLLFECRFHDGTTERWSTHRAIVRGEEYEPRILRHDVFEMQSASDQGVDSIPRISIMLANADSRFSELERSTGWKGARLKVSFLFYDLAAAAPASEEAVLFQGLCNPPDEISESTFRVTATNRMTLQRVLLPQVRIQRRCPWTFPVTGSQRIEAMDGGAEGEYSRFYRCGYSVDCAGGSGSLNDGEPFGYCGYTRADCHARGMFSHFGGIEFVPPAISVRTSGDKEWHTSAVSVSAARYNDFVPLVYGTAWYTPPVVFARNDGNLTRMEVLLGLGEISDVLKVLVNDVEIPVGVAGANMTGTGWYNILSHGSRNGVCNPDFRDGSGTPAGDPYGSMAYLSVAVPNRLNDGTSLPRVKAMVRGLKLPVYSVQGEFVARLFSSNPAWILLDILRRSGWRLSEIDLVSFARAAAHCDEPIETLDVYGNPLWTPRFSCNIALQNRKSAGTLARGIRASARLLLSYGTNGALHLRVENALAQEQPTKPAWSNSKEPLDGGWPSYDFGDGTAGSSGILRRPDGSPSFRVYSRSMADTPNRFSVEFQDAFNEYQQDSLSIADPEDVERSGQEIAATLTAVGLPHYDQAARILKLNLDKSLRGNTYVEFETSVKSFGVRPGDLIAVTYLKEGFNRRLFRVLKIAPGTNFRTSRITAQIHDDAWYSDDNGRLGPSSEGRRPPGGVGTPFPLIADGTDPFGEPQFTIEEAAVEGSDGSVATTLSVGFIAPSDVGEPGPGAPLIDVQATVGPGGTLASGQVHYYAISAEDDAGNESALSFLVRASIPEDGSSVTLKDLSFASGTVSFNAYRGPSPVQLRRIATAEVPSPSFTDIGLASQPVAPPDPNYDHANFYWRLERLPETQCTLHGPNLVGNASLEMRGDAYLGSTVRITKGRGAGQERTIRSNSVDSIEVWPVWSIEPDESSSFAIAESGWQLAAQTKSGPARFAVPNRSGEVVQITGRSANVNDAECDPSLAVVTRWAIGGGGIDKAAPPKPSFALMPGKRGGTVELSGISFATLENTRSISAGTLSLFYIDELLGGARAALAGELGIEGTEIEVTSPIEVQAGDAIQAGSEVMRVIECVEGGRRYTVERGSNETGVSAHAAGEPVFKLLKRTSIAPFPQDFFGSAYSGGWTHSVSLPQARIACAELFVTNRQGNSKAGYISLTNTADMGLRTLSGGQYTIQVDGFLAVDHNATPPLIIERSNVVRDIFAVLGKPADAPVNLELRVDDTGYCTLSFAPGSTVSNSINGTFLPPLIAGSRVDTAITAAGAAYPGADLTIIIRL